jgi:hypothetical protein
MHCYSLGYYSYEDSGFEWLLHENKFTEQEFEDMVLSVTPAIILREIKKETKNIPRRIKHVKESDIWNKDPEVMQAEIKDIEKQAKAVRFEHIYKDVASALCARYGFQRAKREATYSIFGWANICDKDDGWTSDRQQDKQLERMTEKVVDFLKNKDII